MDEEIREEAGFMLREAAFGVGKYRRLKGLGKGVVSMGGCQMMDAITTQVLTRQEA